MKPSTVQNIQANSRGLGLLKVTNYSGKPEVLDDLMVNLNELAKARILKSMSNVPVADTRLLDSFSNHSLLKAVPTPEGGLVITVDPEAQAAVAKAWPAEIRAKGYTPYSAFRWPGNAIRLRELAFCNLIRDLTAERLGATVVEDKGPSVLKRLSDALNPPAPVVPEASTPRRPFMFSPNSMRHQEAPSMLSRVLGALGPQGRVATTHLSSAEVDEQKTLARALGVKLDLAGEAPTVPLSRITPRRPTHS